VVVLRTTRRVGVVDSRLPKLCEVLDDVVTPIVTAPGERTMALTSIDTQDPLLTAAEVATAAAIVGALDHVSVDSCHVVEATGWTLSALVERFAYTWRVAAAIGWPRSGTLKRT
jgi:hypothetical protein